MNNNINPNPDAFEQMSGLKFSELLNMNLNTRDGCYHYYHKLTDTVYSWDFVNGPTPNWVKNGQKINKRLKKMMDRS